MAKSDCGPGRQRDRPTLSRRRFNRPVGSARVDNLNKNRSAQGPRDLVRNST